MKKIIAIMLATLMLVCSLVSCGGGTDYSDLEIVDLGFEVENFGIAFRSGSDTSEHTSISVANIIAIIFFIVFSPFLFHFI